MPDGGWDWSWVILGCYPSVGWYVTVCSWTGRSLVSRAGPTCFAYHGGAQSNRLMRETYVLSKAP